MNGSLNSYAPTDDILSYIDANFEKMFLIKPEQKSKILLYNKDSDSPEWKEQECARVYKSYMNTPMFDRQYKKSYMFGGINEDEIEEKLPEIFVPMLDYAKSTTGTDFNQVVVNWYEKETDYIPMHSDWTDGMHKDCKIAMLSLYGKNDKTRNLKILSKKDPEFGLNLPLYNGFLVVMSSDFQENFRHGIDKLSDEDKISRRIGISFRQYT